MQNYLIKDTLLIPMVKEREFFKGDIYISNGRIQAMGTQLKISKDTIEIDGTGTLTLPGFIQGHIHLVQTLLRHQADDLELLDWLAQKTWPYEASLSPEAVEASARLGIAELLLGGTTTICDFGTTHSHEKVFEAVEDMGLRYIGGKTMMNRGDNVPAPLLETLEDSLRDTYELGKKWHKREGRIYYAVTPRFAVSCTAELMKKASHMARENGWYLQTHSNENKSEVELVKNITGQSNIEFLKDVGFTGKDTILAHCVHLTDAELSLLKESQTRICHCPGSNLKLASGIADVPKMHQNGLLVMLGADGAPCNNRLSIFHEMTLAATLHKVKHGPLAMSAWTVLKMATQDAAKALQLDSEIGTLEVGKRADIVVLNRNSLSMQPDGDPASQIVFGAHPQDVSHVFIDGIPRVMESSLLSNDLEDIVSNASRHWNETQLKMKAFIK